MLISLACATIALAIVVSVLRERAIESAVDFARVPHLVLIGNPVDITARLTIMREAVIETQGEDALQYPSDFPLALVWVVDVSGTYQLQGGAMPTQTPIGHDGPIIVVPTPAPYVQTCVIVVEAASSVSRSKTCRSK